MFDGTAHQNGWTCRIRLNDQTQTVLQNHVRGSRMRCRNCELLQGACSPGRKPDRSHGGGCTLFEAANLLFVSRPLIRSWTLRERWYQGADDRVRANEVLPRHSVHIERCDLPDGLYIFIRRRSAFTCQSIRPNSSEPRNRVS